MSRSRFRVNPHSIVACISRNSLLETESAKLRAIRADADVPTCLVCLRTTHVSTCLACLQVNLSCLLTCLRDNIPYVLTCQRVLRTYVLTCLACLSAQMPTYALRCERAYVQTCLEFFVSTASLPCLISK